MDVSPLAAVLGLSLAWANGANDVSKAIATLVAGGVARERVAVCWGALWTTAGAALSALTGAAMVRTFGSCLSGPGSSAPQAMVSSVLAGAVGWVVLATRAGLPVSTTHALLGALAGGGVVALGTGGVAWAALAGKVALPLLLSPCLAVLVVAGVHPLLRAAARRWEGACLCVLPAVRASVTVDARGMLRASSVGGGVPTAVAGPLADCERAGLRGLYLRAETAHWLSSGLVGLARGANDAPKIAAILLLGGAAGSEGTPAGFLTAIAVAMGVGSLFGGLAVVRLLAFDLADVDRAGALAANLATSALVLASSLLGLPVSTTHVSGGAIAGAGLLGGRGGLRRFTARDVAMGWLVTVPASALLAILAYAALTVAP